MNTRRHSIGGCAALALAGAVLASPALAGGSLKDTPKKEERRCTFSANVALTTEYVFRGYSQTAEGAAVQGGFDATCGIFYAGVWASSLNWDAAPVLTPFGQEWASVEMDWYAGIKPVTGRITWDLGVIYYSYPNSVKVLGVNNDYFELKVGGSAEVWKGGTASLTAFYSPEYQYETGEVWTFEAGLSQALPKLGRFTPTFSALVGYQTGDDAAYAGLFGNGDDSYWYWNAGVALGFHEKWTLDLRYWDTSLSDNAGGSPWCKGPAFQCDARFVATLKFAH